MRIPLALIALMAGLIYERKKSTSAKQQSRQNYSTTAKENKQPSGSVRKSPSTGQPAPKKAIFDEARHKAHERYFWRRQLKAAHCLNRITAIGAVVAFVGLIGVSLTVVFTYQTLKDSRRNAAQQHADTERQIRLSSRPWVGFTDDATPLQTSEIEFDGAGRASISYTIASKNFSSFAAKDVESRAELVITENIEVINLVQERACSDAFIGVPDAGFVLFPGKAQLAESSGTIAVISAPGADGKFQAYLVGCTGYRDQFDVLYKTKFAFRWVAVDTKRPVRFNVGRNIKIAGIFDEWKTSFQ
jgi:hypothetical protein